MLHIPDDPRARRSAALIAQGMTGCLAQTPFQEVTVSALCRRAGVGRATFYRLFDNTADVLAYQCSRIFESVPSAPQEDPALRFIRLWMEHHVLLQAIVESGHIALLENAHRRYVLPFSPALNTVSPEEARYLSATLTACMCAFLSAWLRGDRSEGPQELFALVRRCLSTLAGMI